jgi:hypothetical protein
MKPLRGRGFAVKRKRFSVEHLLGISPIIGSASTEQPNLEALTP